VNRVRTEMFRHFNAETATQNANQAGQIRDLPEL
jgi:hypothetical protein